MANIEDFKEKSKTIKERELYRRTINGLINVGDISDTTINFRLNSGLKNEFEKVCKANHTNIARELKRFMTEVVRTETLL